MNEILTKIRDSKRVGLGVIVGRFQVAEVSDSMRMMILAVQVKHSQVLILVGSTPTIRGTARNPLDFWTVKMMLNEEFPEAVIRQLKDRPSDPEWSNDLDRAIVEHAGMNSGPTIFGSDEGVERYSGRYPSVGLGASLSLSHNDARKISDWDRNSADFRRGMIHAAVTHYPIAWGTVDVAPINRNDPDNLKICLGRKKNDPEGKWRFIGGFVDPTDKSRLAAAKREAREEAPDLSLEDFTHVGSVDVPDWRYRFERDQIITDIFVAAYQFGAVKAGDDLDELQWFPLNPGIFSHVIEQHHGVMGMVIDHEIANGYDYYAKNTLAVR